MADQRRSESPGDPAERNVEPVAMETAAAGHDDNDDKIDPIVRTNIPMSDSSKGDWKTSIEDGLGADASEDLRECADKEMETTAEKDSQNGGGRLCREFSTDLESEGIVSVKEIECASENQDSDSDSDSHCLQIYEEKSAEITGPVDEGSDGENATGSFDFKIQDVIGNAPEKVWDEISNDVASWEGNTKIGADEVVHINTGEESANTETQKMVSKRPKLTVRELLSLKEGKGRKAASVLPGHRFVNKFEPYRRKSTTKSLQLQGRFSCWVCSDSRTFADRDSLRAHMLLAHMEDANAAVSFGDAGSNQTAMVETTASSLYYNIGALTGCYDDSYICSICTRGFKSDNEAAQHISSAHSSWNQKRLVPDVPVHRLFKCTICMTYYQREATFDTHMTMHEKFARSPVLCSLCPCTFTTCVALNEHTLTVHPRDIPKHRPPGGFLCRLCNMQFTRNGVYQAHMKVHSDRAYRVCYLCALAFATDAALETHLLMAHKSTDKRKYKTLANFMNPSMPKDKNNLYQISYQCLVCQEIFVLEAEVKKHVASHASEIFCDICALFCAGGLTKHKVSVHHWCSICSVPHASLDQLQDHMREKHPGHNQTYQYNCSICSKKFENKQTLMEHTNDKHPTTRKLSFRCNHCWTEFSSQKLLRQHKNQIQNLCSVCYLTWECQNEAEEHQLRAHYPIECATCKVTLNGSDRFAEHMKNCSREASTTLKRQSEATPLQCTECKGEFLSLGALNDHFANIHYGCQDCSIKFPTQLSLKKHRMLVHKCYSNCSFCSMVFKNQPQVKVHQIRVHDSVECVACKVTLTGLNSLVEHEKNGGCNVNYPASGKTQETADPQDTKPQDDESQLKCKVCLKQYSDNITLVKHMMGVHYYCSVCRACHSTQGELQEHAIRKHVEVKCSLCSGDFNGLDRFDEHTLSKHTHMFCPYCQSRFEGLQSLKAHIETSHPGQSVSVKYPSAAGQKAAVFLCTKSGCVKEFSNLLALHVHNTNIHYQCPFCHARFQNSVWLSKHQASIHPAKKVSHESFTDYLVPGSQENLQADDEVCDLHKCSHCDSSFTKLSVLKRHMITRHEPMNCVLCDASAFGTNSLNQHWETACKHNPKTGSAGVLPQCPICDVSFRTQTEVTQHEKEQHYPMKCEQCHDLVSGSISLNNHLENGCKASASNRCSFCERDCGTPQGLTSHIRQMHTRMQCLKCNKTLTGSLNLTKHRDSNCDDHFWCSSCQQGFDNPIGLRNHNMALHKPFECTKCNQTFSGYSGIDAHREKGCKSSSTSETLVGDTNLTKHLDSGCKPEEMELSSGKLELLEKYACDMCEVFVTSTKFSLTRHKATVHNVCEICDEAQVTSNELGLHMKRKHLRIKCRFCPEVLIGSDRLKEHFADHEDLFWCEKCEKFFSSKEDLETHAAAHDAGVLTQCEVCGDSFTTVQLLDRHRLTVHDVTTKSVIHCKADEEGKDPQVEDARKVLDRDKKGASSSSDVVITIKDGKVVTTKDGKAVSLGKGGAAVQTVVLNVPDEGGKVTTAPQETDDGEEDPPTHVCETCGKESQSVDELCTHASNMGHKPKFTCSADKCNVTCSAKSDWVAHQSQRHGRSVCQLCSCSFKSKMALGQHLELVHSKLIRYKCTVCDRIFEQKDQMQKHAQEAHTAKATIGQRETPEAEVKMTSQRWMCSVCSLVFDSKADLAKHRYILNHTAKMFKCGVCFKSFETSSEYKLHLKSFHLNTKPVQVKRKCTCGVCKQKFQSKEEFMQHSREKHTEEGWGEFFPCVGTPNQKCNMCFTAADHLTSHVKSAHSDKKSFPCSVEGCMMSYFSRQSRRLHEKKIHGIEQQLDAVPCQCSVCGKPFLKQSHLKVHMKSHNKERPFPCNQCNKTFKNQYRLDRHMLVVHGSGVVQCDLCDSKFGSKNLLGKHLKKHASRAELKCMVCDATFADVDKYVQHVKTHDGEEKAFKCKRCDNTFACLDLYHQHILKEHASEGRALSEECALCDEIFASKKELTKHQTECHADERPFACNKCQRRFKQEHFLKTHVRWAHTLGRSAQDAGDEPMEEDNSFPGTPTSDAAGQESTTEHAPFQGEHNYFQAPSQRKHKQAPSQGEHNQTPSLGEHNYFQAPSQVEHNQAPSQRKHNQTPSQGEHNQAPSQVEHNYFQAPSRGEHNLPAPSQGEHNYFSRSELKSPEPIKNKTSAQPKKVQEQPIERARSNSSRTNQVWCKKTSESTDSQSTDKLLNEVFQLIDSQGVMQALEVGAQAQPSNSPNVQPVRSNTTQVMQPAIATQQQTNPIHIPIQPKKNLRSLLTNTVVSQRPMNNTQNVQPVSTTTGLIQSGSVLQQPMNNAQYVQPVSTVTGLVQSGSVLKQPMNNAQNVQPVSTTTGLFQSGSVLQQSMNSVLSLDDNSRQMNQPMANPVNIQIQPTNNIRLLTNTSVQEQPMITMQIVQPQPMSDAQNVQPIGTTTGMVQPGSVLQQPMNFVLSSDDNSRQMMSQPMGNLQQQNTWHVLQPMNTAQENSFQPISNAQFVPQQQPINAFQTNQLQTVQFDMTGVLGIQPMNVEESVLPTQKW